MTIHDVPSLGSLLRTARIDATLKQSEVARHLGLESGQAVSNWEREVNIPDARNISALVTLYGMNEEEALLAWARANISRAKKMAPPTKSEGPIATARKGPGPVRGTASRKRSPRAKSQ